MASPVQRQLPHSMSKTDHSMLLQSSDTLLDSFYRTPSAQNKDELNGTSYGKLQQQDNAGIDSNNKDNEEYPYNYLKDEPENLFTDWIPKNPQYATDFLFVPFNLERSILYGMFVCLDSFLFVFTSLPIRFLIALWTSVTRGGKLYYVQKIDVLRTVLIFLGFIVVCNIDTSHWGRFVKDSSMKLKMVWMCLEFMDKLLVSYGNNILGSLFWCVSVDREKVIRGRWWHFMVGWAYIVIHASFLLLHLSVLNVAIHEATKALLALLILVQFAEMKGAALKTTKKTALFEMICEDIVERFQLIIYLVWIYLHNKFDNDYDAGNDGEFGLFGSVAIIYLSEFLVDNIKHCSICNFNLISPNFYVKSSAKIAHDLSNAPKSSMLTDRSMALSQSMGLFTLPLTVVVLKLFYEWFPYDTDAKTIMLCLLGYVGLCGLKLLNGLILKAYMYLYKDAPEPEFEEEKKKSD